MTVFGSVIPAANAAGPTVDYQSAISNIKLEFSSKDPSQPAQVGDRVKVTADWKVPNGATGGQTFGMTLPPEFARFASAFALTNAAGDALANCTVADAAAPILRCTLTDFVNGKEDIQGSLFLEAVLDSSTTESTLQFQVGDIAVPVRVPGQGGIRPGASEAAVTSPRKDAFATGENGRMGWTISIPNSAARNGQVTVRDSLVNDDLAYEKHSTVSGSLGVFWRAVDAAGNLTGARNFLPTADYATNFTGGLKEFDVVIKNIPDNERRQYQISYESAPDGTYFEGDKFANKATVQSSEVSARYEWKASGGGSGSASTFTRFTIAKTITGDAASTVPAGTPFTVKYTVGSDTRELPVTIGEENRAQSERYPIGSTFVISEINLPSVPGVDWGKYKITGNGMTDNGDGTYSLKPTSNEPVALTLENIATNQIGNLQVTKTVTGAGTGLVPTDTEYTVNYTYTLNGQQPTTGALKVKPGQTVKMPNDVPLGTEVTLSETKPTDMTIDTSKTVTYGAPIFTSGDKKGQTVTVTVTDPGKPITVTLENPTTLKEVPPTGPTPEPTATKSVPNPSSATPTPQLSSATGLAQTGAQVTGIALTALSIGLVGVLLTVLAVRHRRRT